MKGKCSVILEDCRGICKDDGIPWDKLRGKTILVTGASGLIGQNLVHALLYANGCRGLGLKVLALVRNADRAERILGREDALELIRGDVVTPPAPEGAVDYVVHGASITDSRSFIHTPVEVMCSAAEGTRNLLELARDKKVEGFVFLSSMEVYGSPSRGKTVREEDVAGFRPERVRNSYPVSKQYCEALCCAYASQYNVPAKVIRLTQTFGPGVNADDRRVFAQFMRCALEGRDIVLKTRGETERCYLYTADAVSAILTVLLKGHQGECYTAADPDTYCSISEMAEMVASEIAGNRIRVLYQIDPSNPDGYAETLYMRLDPGKLKALGWKPRCHLREMFTRMMEAYQAQGAM